MKKKSPFKILTLLLVLLFSSTLFGQTFTKTIEKSFDAKEKVAFRQHRGPLLVKKATDAKVSFKSELRVDAKSKAEAEQFFEKIDTDVSEFGDQLEINIGFDRIKRWNQNNNNITITFKDGTRIKGLSNFKIQTILYVPETQLLELASQFNDVTIEETVILNNLKAKLHSADLEAYEVKGDLELDIAFGKAKLGNIGAQVTLKLHDGKLVFGNAKSVDLNGRFSEIKMGQIASLNGDSHEDRVEVAAVSGETILKARFSNYVIKSAKAIEIISHEGSFEIENATILNLNTRFTDYKVGDIQSFKSESHEGQIEIGDVAGDIEIKNQFTNYKFQKVGHVKATSHEGSIVFESAKNVTTNSRFTDFEFGKLNDLTITESHEGNYKLGTVDNIKAKVAFTDFDIEQLNESFVLDAHEGDTEIESVSSNLKKIDLKGRFYEVALTLPSSLAYHLNTNLYFGNINYPSGLEIVKQIEKTNLKQYHLKTKNATDNSAKISMEGHEAKLRIQ